MTKRPILTVAKGTVLPWVPSYENPKRARREDYLQSTVRVGTAHQGRRLIPVYQLVLWG